MFHLAVRVEWYWSWLPYCARGFMKQTLCHDMWNLIPVVVHLCPFGPTLYLWSEGHDVHQSKDVTVWFHSPMVPWAEVTRWNPERSLFRKLFRMTSTRRRKKPRSSWIGLNNFSPDAPTQRFTPFEMMCYDIWKHWNIGQSCIFVCFLLNQIH